MKLTDEMINNEMGRQCSMGEECDGFLMGAKYVRDFYESQEAEPKKPEQKEEVRISEFRLKANKMLCKVASGKIKDPDTWSAILDGIEKLVKPEPPLKGEWTVKIHRYETGKNTTLFLNTRTKLGLSPTPRCVLSSAKAKEVLNQLNAIQGESEKDRRIIQLKEDRSIAYSIIAKLGEGGEKPKEGAIIPEFKTDFKTFDDFSPKVEPCSCYGLCRFPFADGEYPCYCRQRGSEKGIWNGKPLGKRPNPIEKEEPKMKVETESQEELWNEVGGALNGTDNYTYYSKYQEILQAKFLITRKTEKK